MTAESQTFVREPKNQNDHPQINVYFKAAGYKNPEKLAWNHKAWCAAFVTWVYKQCNIPLPAVKGGLAAVATWNGIAVTKKLAPGEATLPSDIVTYKHWSHIEMVKYWPLDPRVTYFFAIGGNTTGGAKQHGVYANIQRPKSFVRNTIRLIR
ncbi:MAG: hypothetical protein U0X91_20665 [Spirosomataceae bacterium]